MEDRKHIFIETLRTISKGFRRDRLVDPEDVFQNLAVYILEKRVPLDLNMQNHSAVRAYAFGMMCRGMMMMRRTAGRYRAALERANRNHLAIGKMFQTDDASDAVITGEMVSMICGSIDQLSEIERQEIQRRFYSPEIKTTIPRPERARQDSIWKSARKKLRILLASRTENQSRVKSAPVHRQDRKIAGPATHCEREAA